MPFRAKMKRAFGGGDSEYDPSNPLAQTSSKKSKKDYPENVYKPGESMPRPKYRGPWNQAHQDKLSSFSFGDSWQRRRSSTGTAKSGSEYSPMGSKLPSRGPSRRGSTWSAISVGGRKKRSLGSRQASHSGYDGYGKGTADDKLKENGEGDDDIGNVGLSRQHTAEAKPPPPPPKDQDVQMNGVRRQETVTNGYAHDTARLDSWDTQRTITNGQLFTADELAQALSQSTLKATPT